MKRMAASVSRGARSNAAHARCSRKLALRSELTTAPRETPTQRAEVDAADAARAHKTRPATRHHRPEILRTCERQCLLDPARDIVLADLGKYRGLDPATAILGQCKGIEQVHLFWDELEVLLKALESRPLGRNPGRRHDCAVRARHVATAAPLEARAKLLGRRASAKREVRGGVRRSELRDRDRRGRFDGPSAAQARQHIPIKHAATQERQRARREAYRALPDNDVDETPKRADATRTSQFRLPDKRIAPTLTSDSYSATLQRSLHGLRPYGVGSQPSLRSRPLTL
jgi:hypothetical protein